MLNITKMELQRLYKSKSFYICLIALFVMFGIIVNSQNQAQMQGTFGNVLDKEYLQGLYMNVDVNIYTTADFFAVFGKSYLPLVFGIYLVIFTCNEYQHGFIKNTVMMQSNRLAIVVSKIVVSLFMLVIAMMVSLLSFTLFGFLFIHGFSMGIDINFFVYIVIWLLVNIAFCSLLIMVSELSENKVIGIILSFVICLGVIIMFIGDYDIFEYSLSYLLTSLPLEFSTDIGLRTIVMSLFYVILYNGISFYWIQKKDIQ